MSFLSRNLYFIVGIVERIRNFTLDRKKNARTKFSNCLDSARTNVHLFCNYSVFYKFNDRLTCSFPCSINKEKRKQIHVPLHEKKNQVHVPLYERTLQALSYPFRNGNGVFLQKRPARDGVRRVRRLGFLVFSRNTII